VCAKPENILLTNTDDDAVIKIADFGFARLYDKGLTTACGTPGYVAPEIISGKRYGCSVDVWSLGVITFILLCGYPPFYNSNQKELFRQIREGRFKFESPYWDPISQDAKDFITGCLTVEVKDRLDVQGMLESKWLVNQAGNEDISKALGEMQMFNAKRKLRAAIKAAIVAHRMQDIAKGFRDNLSSTSPSNGSKGEEQKH
jgi:calcium/calmodulin-dependent protein kinase I